MDRLASRLWRLAYRKDPLTGFILIVGAVDAVIGGVGERWGLFALGAMLAFGALGIRWMQLQRTRQIADLPLPRRFLPAARSPHPLPTLQRKRHRTHY
ncbi:hypothetical protein KR51_00008540 [Rubidibacter lacunae KORDI 51-2]|uniref:Uncharacterized protein n=1 Tax=Rubidibacter lacunae KORDI 51-2 TaxID=582515 RepID=U5DPK4_9CHRO|nr:hypothetical protein [Rubidibacter lacunae]ERN42534.1 hypothetical protein KR51_00008540 [Rubidibacter lacunae KORDI 51-2]